MDLDDLQASAASTRRGKPRQRSAVACEVCHMRRIKCDAVKRGLPCSNCTRVGQSCRLIASKRHGKQKRSASSAPRPVSSPKTSVESGITTNPASATSPSSAAARRQTTHPVSIVSQDAEDYDSEPPAGDDSNNLYAQVLENATSSSERPDILRSASQILYLGETFNLTHLLHHTSQNRQRYARKLHYALPPKPRHGLESQGSREDTAISELLRLQRVFDIPPVEVCHELFRIYFRYVHPHYPILDRWDFALRYQDLSNPPSYLLLQAVLFMAAGHCETSLLHDIGFTSRYEARLTLFKRARALYDADYESDQVTIVQSLFLMSFWWNSLTDQKDTWYWLGNSISLATTLGMHRSTRHSDLSLGDQHLWKRIWWSLFTEDKHAAAALGRPAHIRMRDCDVAPLDETDFNELALPNVDAFGAQEEVHVLYAISLSDLSKILERVVEAAFIPQDQMSFITTETLRDLQARLEDWVARLPRCLHLRPGSDCLWTNNLQIAHSWFQILLHRSIRPRNATDTEREESYQGAMKAASQLVRIVEELLSSRRIQQCPIHIVPALFAAMGMHAIDICSGDVMREQLGTIKIRLSMIALRELKSTWPVSGWIFLLFTKIVRQIRDQGYLTLREEQPRSLSGRPTSGLVDSGTVSGKEVPTAQASGSGFKQSEINQSQAQESHVNLKCDSMIWDPSTIPMPFNFVADWNNDADGSLWNGPDLDFWMMPQGEGNTY